jgi:hypothetical protein
MWLKKYQNANIIRIPNKTTRVNKLISPAVIDNNNPNIKVVTDAIIPHIEKSASPCLAFCLAVPPNHTKRNTNTRKKGTNSVSVNSCPAIESIPEVELGKL